MTTDNSRAFSPQQILYEDNHLLIINKKVGQLVQGDKTGDASLLDDLKAYIKQKENKPGNVFLGLVHRIDRPTSGLVIFAKTSKALSRMTEKFKNREIQKTYWALVPREALAPEATLKHYLKKNEANNKAIVYNKELPGSKLAVLHYRVIGQAERYQLLEVDLETGRHHQIRAQLSTLGVAIKGDLKYGAPRSNKNGGISLHARRISFQHPTTKEEMVVEADYAFNPEDAVIIQAIQKEKE